MEKFAPLLHEGTDTKSDTALQAEEQAFLDARPNLQFLKELLQQLTGLNLPWWSAHELRLAFPASVRMAWLVQRPDIRQRITTELTGLSPKIARKRSPEAQAQLIDSAIDDGDKSVEDFEGCFQTEDIVVYGDVPGYSKLFRDQMPWIAIDQGTRDLVGSILSSLLLPREGDKALMTHLEMRLAIDETIWQKHMPVEIRAKIARTRLERERREPSKPFTAKDELEIATPGLIATNLPLKELYSIYETGEKLMGFTPDPPITALVLVTSGDSGSDSTTTSDDTPKLAEAKPEDPEAPPVSAAARHTPVVPPPDPPGLTQAPPGPIDPMAMMTLASDASEHGDGEISFTESAVEPGELEGVEGDEPVSTKDGPANTVSDGDVLPKNSASLDMGEFGKKPSLQPPPPKDGSGSTSKSGLKELHKTVLKEKLSELNLTLKTPEEYPLQDLDDLLQVLGNRTWLDDQARNRVIMESFLHDRDPELYSRSALAEKTEDFLCFKFLAAIQEGGRGNNTITQALNEDRNKRKKGNKKSPPPFPATGSSKK